MIVYFTYAMIVLRKT
jgi:hypothetical protein